MAVRRRLLTAARGWSGVLAFISVFVLSSLSRSVNDWVWSLHPGLARTIEDQHQEIISLSHNIRRGFSDQQRTLSLHGLASWSHEVFLDVPIKSLATDTLTAGLDCAQASWILSRSMLRMWFEIIRMIVRVTHFASPHIAPPIRTCIHEFATLPFRAQLIIGLTLVINTGMYIAWRKRWIAKSMEALSTWHRRVADMCMTVGPYLIVVLMLYLPTKHALAFNQFRAVFQSVVFGLAIVQSSIATGQLWYIKRSVSPSESTEVLRTPHPATARPFVSNPPMPPSTPSIYLASSNWLATIVTPRTSLVSPRPPLDAQHRNHVAASVHNFLSFWAVMVCLHGVLYFPERLIEYLVGAPIPIFNVWHVGQSYLSPVKRLILTRSAFANDRLESITMFADETTLWRRWPKTLLMSLITVEEVITLCLFLAAMTCDPKLASMARRGCIWVLETIVHSLTGIRVELVPRTHRHTWLSSSGSSELPSSELPAPPNRGFIGRVIVGVKDSLTRHSTEWRSLAVLLHLEKVGDAIFHLFPLVFLIAPVFILRYVLLIAALLIPMIYSLKALQQNNMGKIGYWLTYSTAFMLYVCVLDICAYSSPLAAWLAFALRPKLVAVLFIQLICTEPDTLGVWVVKQASRMSVSALATARRHVSRSPVIHTDMKKRRRPEDEMPVLDVSDEIVTTSEAVGSSGALNFTSSPRVVFTGDETSMMKAAEITPPVPTMVLDTSSERTVRTRPSSSSKRDDLFQPGRARKKSMVVLTSGDDTHKVLKKRRASDSLLKTSKISH